MTFFTLRRVNGREYVYEMESYRDVSGQARNRIIRYVGPTSPIYGRPAVDFDALRRAKLHAKRRRTFTPKTASPRPKRRLARSYQNW